MTASPQFWPTNYQHFVMTDYPKLMTNYHHWEFSMMTDYQQKQTPPLARCHLQRYFVLALIRNYPDLRWHDALSLSELSISGFQKFICSTTFKRVPWIQMVELTGQSGCTGLSELKTVETSKNLWIQGEKHPCSEDRKKKNEWLENVFCHVDPLTGNNPIPRT